jgi:hypothetical protein
MIISQPDDGRGLLYPIVDLNGQTVHTYRDFQAAMRSIEGDQRLCIQDEASGKWVTDPPAPAVVPAITQAGHDVNAQEFERIISLVPTTEPDAQLEEVARIRANARDACLHGLITKAQWGLLSARLDVIEQSLKGA